MTECFTDEADHFNLNSVVSSHVSHEHVKQFLALSDLDDYLAVVVLLVHWSILTLLTIFTDVRHESYFPLDYSYSYSVRTTVGFQNYIQFLTVTDNFFHHSDLHLVSNDITMDSPNENLVTPGDSSLDELIKHSDSFLSAGQHFFQLSFLLILVGDVEVLLVPEPQIENVVCESVNNLSLVISDLIFYLNEVGVSVLVF